MSALSRPAPALARAGAFLILAAAAAGCAERFAGIGEAPQMSTLTTLQEPIDPNAEALDRVLNAQTPTNAPTRLSENPTLPGDARPIETASIGRGAQTASLWSIGPRSLFDDRRARFVGDIVTVLIEISDEATINNSTNRSRSGSESVDIPSIYGLDTIADTILPGDGVLNPGAEIESSTSTSGSGGVSRTEEIDLRIAATVIDVLPNGHLIVTGNQEVRVNFELRDLQVAGVIRPEDITRNNTITYDKMANARISYGGRGQITEVQQPRYGQQVLERVSPF